MLMRCSSCRPQERCDEEEEEEKRRRRRTRQQDEKEKGKKREEGEEDLIMLIDTVVCDEKTIEILRTIKEIHKVRIYSCSVSD